MTHHHLLKGLIYCKKLLLYVPMERKNSKLYSEQVRVPHMQLDRFLLQSVVEDINKEDESCPRSSHAN